MPFNRYDRPLKYGSADSYCPSIPTLPTKTKKEKEEGKSNQKEDGHNQNGNMAERVKLFPALCRYDQGSLWQPLVAVSVDRHPIKVPLTESLDSAGLRQKKWARRPMMVIRQMRIVWRNFARENVASTSRSYLWNECERTADGGRV